MKIHIDHIAAHNMVSELSDRFGINKNCMFSMNWYLDLPDEFIEEIYEQPSEVRVTVR
jgi:hypothetical protein